MTETELLRELRDDIKLCIDCTEYGFCRSVFDCNSTTSGYKRNDNSRFAINLETIAKYADNEESMINNITVLLRNNPSCDTCSRRYCVECQDGSEYRLSFIFADAIEEIVKKIFELRNKRKENERI